MNNKITPKQLEIIQLIADGFSSKQIAKELGVSTRTLESHKLNMYNKFDVNHSAHLIAFGFRNGYLT